MPKQKHARRSNGRIVVLLTELMKEMEWMEMTRAPAADTKITGLTADSREVKPGFLFAALPGADADGRDFIADAIAQGAAAILTEPGTIVDTVPLLAHAVPRRRYAELAARFYGTQPAHIAAVTGTNGKSSVADFTRQLWSHLGLAILIPFLCRKMFKLKKLDF